LQVAEEVLFREQQMVALVVAHQVQTVQTLALELVELVQEEEEGRRLQLVLVVWVTEERASQELEETVVT
jgi:hypothetical protein